MRGFSCACVLCLPRPEQFRQPEAWAPSRWVRRAFSLRGERARAARGLAHSPLAWSAFSLRGPSARPRSGLRNSSDRNPRLFAGWEGVASLGLSLPLSPPPCLLPPAGMGRLFSGVSQSLCFANRRRCVPAGCSLLLRKTVTCGAQLEIRRLRYVSRMGFVKKLKQGRIKREKYNIIRHILHKNNSDPEKTFHLNINTFKITMCCVC